MSFPIFSGQSHRLLLNLHSVVLRRRTLALGRRIRLRVISALKTFPSRFHYSRTVLLRNSSKHVGVYLWSSLLKDLPFPNILLIPSTSQRLKMRCRFNFRWKRWRCATSGRRSSWPEATQLSRRRSWWVIFAGEVKPKEIETLAIAALIGVEWWVSIDCFYSIGIGLSAERVFVGFSPKLFSLALIRMQPKATRRIRTRG